MAIMEVWKNELAHTCCRVHQYSGTQLKELATVTLSARFKTTLGWSRLFDEVLGQAYRRPMNRAVQARQLDNAYSIAKCAIALDSVC